MHAAWSTTSRTAGSLKTMRDAAHRSWRADLETGVPSPLIVPTNEDTVALDVETRELRLRRGEIPQSTWR